MIRRQQQNCNVIDAMEMQSSSMAKASAKSLPFLSRSPDRETVADVAEVQSIVATHTYVP